MSPFESPIKEKKPGTQVRAPKVESSAAHKKPDAVLNSIRMVMSKDYEIAREINRMYRSGRLKLASRFFAFEGPSSTYAFSKEYKMVYSAAHGLIKCLNRLGYVEISTVDRNEKGALTKFYRLSEKGLREALRYCNPEEIVEAIKRWAGNDKSGLLMKLDYLVHKIGKGQALIAISNSFGSGDLMGQFVKNFLDFVDIAPESLESLRTEWIPLLSGDEQLRRTTIQYVSGRISMMELEKSHIDEQIESLMKIQRDLDVA